MESMLNFVTKFTGVVRNHIAETSECLGKEVVDSTAKKSGICVDKIKVAYGAKFSMLGHNYSDSVMKQLESFDEDVLVCQGKSGLFFIPMSEVGALGNALILVNAKIGQPENGSMDYRKEEVFRKFSRTRGDIKKFLPNVEESAPARKKRGRLNIFY